MMITDDPAHDPGPVPGPPLPPAWAFRLRRIEFDEDGNVDSVLARATGPGLHAVLKLTTGFVHNWAASSGEPGKYLITLPLAQVRELYAKAGKIPGTHPAASAASDIFSAACLIIERVMGEDQ